MKWRSLEESTPGADDRPLCEIFAERKELISQYVPQEIQSVHEQAITELRDQGISKRALAVGAKAPSFELKDHNGRTVSSAEILKTDRLVICFFRGRWCPFCVGQMEAMNYVVPQIMAAGASVVVISPQTEKQAFFMRDQHQLTFPMLVDAHNDVARQFGLVYRVPDEQQALYRSTFVNLPFVNGDNSWELPIPASYVIDRDGTILFASADEDYSQRPEPLEILKVLERAT